MTNLPTKKILAIAKNTPDRLFFLEYLKAHGFLTIDAEDGLNGFEQARQHLPDLIIYDLVISQLEGFSFLTKLR